MFVVKFFITPGNSCVNIYFPYRKEESEETINLKGSLCRSYIVEIFKMRFKKLSPAYYVGSFCKFSKEDKCYIMFSVAFPSSPYYKHAVNDLMHDLAFERGYQGFLPALAHA